MSDVDDDVGEGDIDASDVPGPERYQAVAALFPKQDGWNF